MSKKPLKTDNSINNKPGKKKNSSYNPGKLIVNEINEPLIIWDKNQRISFANQAAQKIFRLPIEDILNKPFGFPESIIEERVVDKDNILRYFDVIPIIMLALDVKGVITLINKKGCELIGCGENKTIGVNWFDNFVPEDVRKELKKVHIQLVTGKIAPLDYYENPIISKDGSEKIIAWHNSLIEDDSGKIIGSLHSGVDITERKKMEEELIRWKERYEIVADTSGQVVYDFDVESGNIQWSGNIEQVLGYSKKEMGDINSWIDMIHPEDRDESLKVLDIAKREMNVYDVEYRFRHKKGYYLFIHDTGVFIPGEKGTAKTMIGMMHNITERKRIENALIESEKKYRLLFENVTVGFALHEIICDDEGIPEDYRFLEINPAFEALLNVKAKEVVGKRIKELHPQVDEFYIEAYGRVALTGKSEHFEKYIPEFNKYFYFYAFSPGHNQFAVVISDITEIKNQQEKIREREELLRVFINAVVDPLFMIDKKGQAVYVNKAIADNFGKSPDVLIGENIYSFLPVDVANKRKELNNKVFETGEPIRYEDERDGGFFNNFVYPVFDDNGKVKNIAILSSDITEKKKAEIALKESQERLSETEKFSLIMSTHVGLDGSWLKVPPTLCDLLGFTEEELLSQNVKDITHPEDYQKDVQYRQRLIRGEAKSYELEKRYIRKDGRVVWVYINYSIVLDEKNRPVHFVNYIKDISDRKTAEEALKKNEQLLSAITNTASDAIVLIDNEGKVSYWNPSAERMFGYTAEEMIGKELHNLLSPKEFLSEFRKGFGIFKQSGRGRAIDSTLVFTALKKDGTQFPIEVSTSAMKIDNKWLAAGIIRDITDRKKAEELIKSSLQEKEIMLREIHHRVKNNLQVISSLLSIQAHNIKDEYALHVFKESQSRIKSIALVHENLYQSEKFSSVNFNDYINSLIKEIFRTYGEYAEQITLNTEIESINMGVDYAIPCGLIINEAISNSLNYAFPEELLINKKCEISLKMKSVNEKEIELVIEDNGIGLPADSQLEKTETLGIHLIKILATGQLKGDMKIERDNGTKFIIKFKID